MSPLIAVVLQLTVVTPATQPMGRNFSFCVDVSLSMNSHLKTAVGNFVSVVQQPNDDMAMKVRAFGGTSTVMSAKWVKLPDALAVTAAGAWLLKPSTRKLAASGQTYVLPALMLALREKKRELTVILITDGIFSEADDKVLKAIAAAQAWRIKQKLGRAVIAVVARGQGKSVRKILVAIAKGGGGGLYR